MQKLKSLNWSSLVSVLKCCLLGIIVTLVGVVAFAVVLKFVDLSSVAVSYINDIIKALAILTIVFCIKKSNDGKLIFKAVLGGVIYALLSFIIFSIMNGGFSFNLSFIFDLLFAVIVAIIASVIVNITYKRKV